MLYQRHSLTIFVPVDLQKIRSKSRDRLHRDLTDSAEGSQREADLFVGIQRLHEGFEHSLQPPDNLLRGRGNRDFTRLTLARKLICQDLICASEFLLESVERHNTTSLPRRLYHPRPPQATRLARIS